MVEITKRWNCLIKEKLDNILIGETEKDINRIDLFFQFLEERYDLDKLKREFKEYEESKRENNKTKK